MSCVQAILSIIFLKTYVRFLLSLSYLICLENFSSAVLILAGCEVLSHGGLSISLMVGTIEHLFRFPFILLLRINC